MLKQRRTSFFLGISKKISSIHPIIYIVFYVSLIPIFAGLYCIIPAGFYAPYVRLEYNGQSDAYEIGVMIQTAIRRGLRARLEKSSNHSNNIKIREELLYVQRLSVTDSSEIKFDIYTMFWDEERNGNIQIPLHVVMRAPSKIITFSATGDVKKTFRYVELGSASQFPEEFGNLVGLVFIEIFKPADVFINGPLLELSDDEDQKLSRFFDGIGGNATAVTGAYGRMLYFSSIVITTVGFGDIVPMTALARGIVAFEAVLGVILAGLFLNAIAYRAAGGR